MDKYDQIEKGMDGVIRRYRMVGNIKEYEPTITFAGFPIPQSQYKEVKKEFEESVRAKQEAEKQKVAELAALRRECPLDTTKGMNSACIREECALFDNGCSLARLIPARDTEGLKCPLIRRECRHDCALYHGGCTLTGILNTEREGK